MFIFTCLQGEEKRLHQSLVCVPITPSGSVHKSGLSHGEINLDLLITETLLMKNRLNFRPCPLSEANMTLANTQLTDEHACFFLPS